MSRIDVLRPFIEKNLAALAGSDKVAPDASGEYVFPHGSAEISCRLPGAQGDGLKAPYLVVLSQHKQLVVPE